MIVRPLTPDFDWDEYVDLTIRAFGPADEAMVRSAIAMDLAVPLQITDDLRSANSGRWDLTVRAGPGRPDADVALDGAFAATPFMLDGF